ncbi:MAG TPA: hypothetical protein VGF99_08515 [Myxococcota bacterium]
MSSLSDLRSSINRAALFVSLLASVAAGCDSCCAPEVLNPPDRAACVLPAYGEGCDNPSKPDFRYGECNLGGCEVDADCCPGTRCRTDQNACVPRLLDADFECETNADCEDPAQVCANVSAGGDRPPLPTCIYEACSGDADCGFGRACFASRCVTNAPCGGSCPVGSVCEVNTNSCHPLPAAGAGINIEDSCRQDCTDGLLVLKDEATMVGEFCCDLQCDCRERPPIVPTRIGRYARIVVTGDEAIVSAYDGEFGDLVVVRHTLGGERTGIEYVDGVPAEAPTGDPSGARGGVRGAGLDVGTHTSIVANAEGLARVAYHDVTGNGLKVAIEGPKNVWSTHTIESTAAIGQLGTFTDMAILGNGTLLVSYLAHLAPITGITGPASAVKLARSRTPNPTSAADWEIITVDARSVTVDPAATVEAPGMPRGRGLHTDLLVDGDVILVGYYDEIDGDVRVARIVGTTITTTVLDGDGANGHLNGDIGRFPALGIVGIDLFVTYEDATRHALRVWRGPKETPGVGGTYGVADQLREPNRSGNRFVGAGARMSTTGHPVLVYQDASNLDLRMATLEGSSFVPTTILADGANGFYTDVAVVGNKAYVCSVVAELDSRGKERSRLRLDVQTLP